MASAATATSPPSNVRGDKGSLRGTVRDRLGTVRAALAATFAGDDGGATAAGGGLGADGAGGPGSDSVLDIADLPAEQQVYAAPRMTEQERALKLAFQEVLRARPHRGAGGGFGAVAENESELSLGAGTGAGTGGDDASTPISPTAAAVEDAPAGPADSGTLSPYGTLLMTQLVPRTMRRSAARLRGPSLDPSALVLPRPTTASLATKHLQALTKALEALKKAVGADALAAPENAYYRRRLVTLLDRFVEVLVEILHVEAATKNGIALFETTLGVVQAFGDAFARLRAPGSIVELAIQTADIFRGVPADRLGTATILGLFVNGFCAQLTRIKQAADADASAPPLVESRMLMTPLVLRLVHLSAGKDEPGTGTGDGEAGTPTEEVARRRAAVTALLDKIVLNRRADAAYALVEALTTADGSSAGWHVLLGALRKYFSDPRELGNVNPAWKAENPHAHETALLARLTVRLLQAADKPAYEFGAKCLGALPLDALDDATLAPVIAAAALFLYPHEKALTSFTATAVVADKGNKRRQQNASGSDASLLTAPSTPLSPTAAAGGGGGSSTTDKLLLSVPSAGDRSSLGDAAAVLAATEAARAPITATDLQIVDVQKAYVLPWLDKARTVRRDAFLMALSPDRAPEVEAVWATSPRVNELQEPWTPARSISLLLRMAERGLLGDTLPVLAARWLDHLAAAWALKVATSAVAAFARLPPVPSLTPAVNERGTGLITVQLLGARAAGVLSPRASHLLAAAASGGGAAPLTPSAASGTATRKDHKMSVAVVSESGTLRAPIAAPTTLDSLLRLLILGAEAADGGAGAAYLWGTLVPAEGDVAVATAVVLRLLVLARLLVPVPVAVYATAARLLSSAAGGPASTAHAERLLEALWCQAVATAAPDAGLSLDDYAQVMWHVRAVVHANRAAASLAAAEAAAGAQAAPRSNRRISRAGADLASVTAAASLLPAAPPPAGTPAGDAAGAAQTVPRLTMALLLLALGVPVAHIAGSGLVAVEVGRTDVGPIVVCSARSFFGVASATVGDDVLRLGPPTLAVAAAAESPVTPAVQLTPEHLALQTVLHHIGQGEGADAHAALTALALLLAAPQSLVREPLALARALQPSLLPAVWACLSPASRHLAAPAGALLLELLRAGEAATLQFVRGKVQSANWQERAEAAEHLYSLFQELPSRRVALAAIGSAAETDSPARHLAPLFAMLIGLQRDPTVLVRNAADRALLSLTPAQRTLVASCYEEWFLSADATERLVVLNELHRFADLYPATAGTGLPLVDAVTAFGGGAVRR